MPRYIIERSVPAMSREELAAAARLSNKVLEGMPEVRWIRSYVSEPKRGRRRWKQGGEELSQERSAVYANRRRVRGTRGKKLLRKRGEFLERPFAHCLDTGGMRRVHLRGASNILKRLLVHVAGFNLGLVMRTVLGVGTPRAWGAVCAALSALSLLLHAMASRWSLASRSLSHLFRFSCRWALGTARAPMTTSATGC